MDKRVNVIACVDEDVKNQAEEILSQLGISTSMMIELTFRQVILKRGVPFRLELPLPDHKLSPGTRKNGYSDKVCERPVYPLRRSGPKSTDCPPDSEEDIWNICIQ